MHTSHANLIGPDGRKSAGVLTKVRSRAIYTLRTSNYVGRDGRKSAGLLTKVRPRAIYTPRAPTALAPPRQKSEAGGLMKVKSRAFRKVCAPSPFGPA